jgi:hypothetical protein
MDADETNTCTTLFRSLLNESSERALVIVAVAHLDALGEDAIRRMTAGMEFGFERNLKILVARGLLVDTAKDFLMAMYRIRNHFAHTPQDCSLSDEMVRSDLVVLHRLDSLVESSLRDLDERLAASDSREKKFLACATILLSANLIAAKKLCPDPLTPPQLADFLFDFGE